MSGPKYQILPILVRLGACSAAKDWIQTAAHPTFEHAWLACSRPDWLLWLAARAGVDRRVLVLVACDIAEQALAHVKPGEDRPRTAIETARRWVRGEATLDEVRTARRAAAAYAAAYADADAAAAAAAAAAARSESYAKACELVRAAIPWRDVETGLVEFARASGCLVEIAK